MRRREVCKSWQGFQGAAGFPEHSGVFGQVSRKKGGKRRGELEAEFVGIGTQLVLAAYMRDRGGYATSLRWNVHGTWEEAPCRNRIELARMCTRDHGAGARSKPQGHPNSDDSSAFSRGAPERDRVGNTVSSKLRISAMTGHEMRAGCGLSQLGVGMFVGVELTGMMFFQANVEERWGWVGDAAA